LATRIIRELLSRRDPEGYFVIPLRNAPEARRLAEESGAVIEEAGDVILARLRSRSAAERLARAALSRRLLAESV